MEDTHLNELRVSQSAPNVLAYCPDRLPPGTTRCPRKGHLAFALSRSSLADAAVEAVDHELSPLEWLARPRLLRAPRCPVASGRSALPGGRRIRWLLTVGLRLVDSEDGTYPALGAVHQAYGLFVCSQARAHCAQAVRLADAVVVGCRPSLSFSYCLRFAVVGRSRVAQALITSAWFFLVWDCHGRRRRYVEQARFVFAIAARASENVWSSRCRRFWWRMTCGHRRRWMHHKDLKDVCEDVGKLAICRNKSYTANTPVSFRQIFGIAGPPTSNTLGRQYLNNHT